MYIQYFLFLLGLGSIYNEYLISMINSDAISSVLDLYQHSFGPRKDILTISHSVLRGLVVAFSNHGMTKAAKSVFMQGLLRNVYSIKKVYIFFHFYLF